MKKIGYSHILDVVAGDQVPKNLDLAPNIMARIQQRKGVRMQPRIKFMYATMLVAITMVVLFYTVPGMAAAIGRWFGYMPGVGLVREGQIRVLAEPVSISREGITVTVEQVVLDPERTSLVYSVEGIPSAAIVTDPLDQRCPYAVLLRLPDGSEQQASPDGLQSWASGYQHRFNYPPMPAAVNDATLVINCLFNTRPGTAPENWEIPLRFVPAPPHVTVFPVIEIPTTTALVPTDTNSTGTAKTAANLVGTEAHPDPVMMEMSLDRAVEMDDGYLIYATVHWEDTPYIWADVTDPDKTLHLLDANGHEMLYELVYDEQTGLDQDQRQTVFGIKTAPVQNTGPLTLALDSVSVDLPVEDISFVFNPGPDPKPGQIWTLNQTVKVGEYNLRVNTATADDNGYSFEMSSANGIVNATLTDYDNPAGGGGGGGGGGNPGENFSYGISYTNGLPDGPVKVSIISIGVRHIQHMETQWTPPAASANLLPTQPAACLTAASWNTALAHKPALPDGITGRVLTSGLVDANTGQWNDTLSNLDGSNPQVFEGAQDGAVSPDGTKLVYSVYGGGISIADLASGQVTPVPGTGNGDFNPIWSPDGTQIVFNRGMGVFDLFLINLDGSDMRQLTHGGVQEWPVGWLPDGKFLYTVPGREDEYTIYQLDVQSGVIEEYSQDNLASISPDGKYILTNEKTFSDRWLVYISDLDGSNRWLLNDSSLWVLTPIWSPDGQWLLAGVSATDSGSTIGALINLRTCQVIPLPNLKGNLLSWVP